MSEDTHPVRYGAGRTCEACDQKFSVFDDFRKVVIESDDDNFPAPAYFLCGDCTSRVLEPLEGESSGITDFS
ncbi:MAG: hypothetical protein J07HR59_00903 [Halorubrum sp. J07HR59]|jgi:hypothetical protein|nr:MAG: hypothetical protein J07HR59_00903 [Halorubrum sp. J07HR59]